MRPVSRSRKIIDQVMSWDRGPPGPLMIVMRAWRPAVPEDLASPSRGVALHAARIGGGPAPRILAAGGGQAAFGPVVVHLDLMAALTQFLDRFLRHPALQHQYARTGGARPERRGE